MDEGLLRFGDLGGDEPRPRLEERCVGPECGRDDPVFVGGSVHARASELRGLSGVEHKLGAFLRQASPALGILDVVTDLHADAAEVEVEHVILSAGSYAAFQHDLPFGTDPIQDGVDLDVPTGQPTLPVDHDGGVRAGGIARIVENNTAEYNVRVMLARLGPERRDDRVIERDSSLGGVPGLPAVMAYSVKSARSMDRPYFKRDSSTIWSIRRRICSSRPLRPG